MLMEYLGGGCDGVWIRGGGDSSRGQMFQCCYVCVGSYQIENLCLVEFNTILFLLGTIYYNGAPTPRTRWPSIIGNVLPWRDHTVWHITTWCDLSLHTRLYLSLP